MAKHKGEPVGWVTANGKHIPKWKDGSIGWDNDGEEKKVKSHNESKMSEKHKSKDMKPEKGKIYQNQNGAKIKVLYADDKDVTYRITADKDADMNTAGPGKEEKTISRESFNHMTSVNGYESKSSLTDQMKEANNKKSKREHEFKKKDTGVTRKDVEELTAKKDSLKGVDLKTKPITPEEISEAKKRMEHTFKKKDNITTKEQALKDIKNMKMSEYDRDEISYLYKDTGGAWVHADAMERAIEKPLSGKKTSTEKSLRRNFDQMIQAWEDVKYTVDSDEAKEWIDKEIKQYKKRFEDNLKKWKDNK